MLRARHTAVFCVLFSSPHCVADRIGNILLKLRAGLLLLKLEAARFEHLRRGGVAHLPAASRRAWTARASPARPEVDSGARFQKRGVLLTPRFFSWACSISWLLNAMDSITPFSDRNYLRTGITGIVQEDSVKTVKNTHLSSVFLYREREREREH